MGSSIDDDCTPTDRRELYLDLHSTLAAALGTEDVDVTLLDDIPPSVGRQVLQSYEVLVGDSALAEQVRRRYEAAAPPPAHEELVERLDEGLLLLDDALKAGNVRRARRDGE